MQYLLCLSLPHMPSHGQCGDLQVPRKCLSLLQLTLSPTGCTLERRWHPNPQNPHEVQLRKKIDMKWEREKRRRKKRREEAAAAATAKPAATAEAAEPAATAEAAEPAATAEAAEPAATAEAVASSSSKPDPVPLAIQEQKPKMMAKKEKKPKKEKKHAKKRRFVLLFKWKKNKKMMMWSLVFLKRCGNRGEEWADELTKEWLAQPACDEEEKKFKDFCRRKDLQQVMPDDQSDPALILVSIGKKSLLGHRCCVQISHVFFYEGLLCFKCLSLPCEEHVWTVTGKCCYCFQRTLISASFKLMCCIHLFSHVALDVSILKCSFGMWHAGEDDNLKWFDDHLLWWCLGFIIWYSFHSLWPVHSAVWAFHVVCFAVV